VRRLTVVALAALLLLTGCSGSGTAAKSTGSTPGTSATASPSPSAAATASAADIASLAAVKVDGPFGSAPTITLTQPFTVSTTVARVVTPGTGEDLKKGQALQINYVGVNAKDGSAVGDNFKTKPDVFVLGEADLMAAINNVLVGQKVGVRALVAVVDTTNQTTTVLSMDVISAKSILSRAEGTAVAPVDGLPAVTLASDGKPSVTLPAATKPAALVAQDLITGAGPVVQSGQTITVHYTGWTWDGNAFDSSWDKGSTFSTTIGSGEVIKGWETGLIGKAVGSQVLLVVPPDQGYGTSANGPIPGGSTLVFVVDILNAS
jgi:FKBP-type peptidyl-prolyl cis-trans isomerase